MVLEPSGVLNVLVQHRATTHPATVKWHTPDIHFAVLSPTQSKAHLMSLDPTPPPTSSPAPVLLIHHLVPGSVDQVFAAWTDADVLSEWWGPVETTCQVVRLECRKGGIFHYAMKADGKPTAWGVFRYVEVVAPSRLVFLNSFADADGNPIHPPFDMPWPRDMRTTVDFTPADSGTMISLFIEPYNASDAEVASFSEHFDSMRSGFGGTMSRLAQHLTSPQ